MKRILIDGGSSSDILFMDALEALGKTKKDLKEANFPMVGFSGSTSYPLGVITLSVEFGSGWKSERRNVEFVVVDSAGTYNAIIGRTTINPLMAVASTVHQKMKFMTDHGVGEIKGDQVASRKCYVNATRRRRREAMNVLQTDTDPREEFGRPAPVEYLKQVEND